jgi:tetratricopeptide (TPR) repeat protein
MANPHIINFIQSLSPIETRLVEEQIEKTQSLFSNSENDVMEVKLFKYIIQNRKNTIPDSTIIELTGTKRVTDLKNNLFSKVLETLTLDKYITNKELFNENDITSFTLKKKLFIFKIAFRSLNQGKTEALYEMLEDIIESAKKFELYDLLVEALNSKKYLRTMRTGGLSAFEAINSEIEFYDYCYKALIKANDNYYRLILNNEFIRTLSKSEADQHILASIKQMEDDYKKTRSEQINYYLTIMRFAYCENQKDYNSAILHCTKLLSILKNNKAIYRNERLGFAYTNLCQYNTFLGRYNEALKNAKKSQQYYLEDSFNNAVSKEQEFYTNFYNEDYSAANKCLNQLLSHSKIDTGEFRRSKFVYYRACVYFADKNFKEALHLLNESLEIEKDKTRWNISLRILNIMIFIEMNKINEAVNSLESLRKYMERTGKTDEVSARDILIVKLLREIEKDGFEYNPENKNAIKMLNQLSEKDMETSWEYFSSELIPFHEWLNKKKRLKN